MKRLTDEQATGLFLLHWDKTHDLDACVRLVRDADRYGEPQALARSAAAARAAHRPVVIARAIDRAKIVQLAQPILRRFAHAAGVDVRQLYARRGSTRMARIRYEAAWVLRKLTDMSSPEIGLALGGRSHSDVLAGVRKTEDRIATDDVARARLLAFVERETAEKKRAA